MNNVRIAEELVKIAKSLTEHSERPYYFEMECYEKSAEQDEYKKGCNGEYVNFSMDIKVQDRNLKECVKKAFNSLGMTYTNIDDVYIDDGRIVISREENGEGEQPSQSEIQAWKRGQIVLWLADYEWTVTIRTDEQPSAQYIEDQLKKN